jgi:AcrR family transcriptional regulator
MAAVIEPLELPVVEEQRAERADAARNRQAILQAARRLLRDTAPGAITMDQLALEAGVGKGTLFRRFGSRASLFHALLDETERELQEAFIRGPAPLGPGAPANERLVAFGHALLTLTDERGDLLLAAEPAGQRFRAGSLVRAAYRSHIAGVLDPVCPGHAPYLADVLLAALAPELILEQRRAGMSLAELKHAWKDLIGRLLGDDDRGGPGDEAGDGDGDGEALFRTGKRGSRPGIPPVPLTRQL